MKIKSLLHLGIVLTVLCMSGMTAAQSDIAIATRTAKLQALSENLKRRDDNDRRQAEAWARHTGIPLRRELPNGTVLELQRFKPGVGPTFYITNNVDAADTVSTDEVWPGGSAGLSLDGSGMTEGEWDAGAILADHPDLYQRVTQVDGATVLSNHSTHVAGTLIGAGVALLAEARGMAYAADLDAWDWNSDTAEMALAAANGLLMSNHSYGIAAGWICMGGAPPDGWWWIGGNAPTDIEDPNFGYYDSETQLWDQIAFDAPYYLIVKAAGNDHWDTGPAPGEEYTVIDQNGDFQFLSTEPRDPDCGPVGYDCLPTASVAKNILTVGAVNDVAGGYSPAASASQVQMTGFSGWGPTDDGRIKPDVVGNGWLLMSTYAEDPYYAAALGTSMAAPNVTGSLLLLQEHYQNIHGGGNFMRAATLKALAIHTADEAGAADGPDYEYGWGLLNTKSAAKLITEDGGLDHQIIEGSLANGATDTVQINVSETDAIVTVTLVWTDPPGTPAAPALDPPDSMLVNDLDLRISIGASTYMPWVLNPASPATAATTGDNFRDNVEQVVINAGGTGVYSVDVSHKGTLLSGANQNYSLIVSVAPPPPTSTGFLIDEDFSGGLPAGWSVDTVQGVSWTINTPVPGDPRLDNSTGGAGNFAIVDNDNTNTLTSLRTPVLDLSSAEAVVLRFKSYYPVLHDFESLNVDLSTDGGSNWVNVWYFAGFNPFPTNYALDLSGQTVGHATVMLRFRWTSGGWNTGDLWQIDDVELEVFGGTPPPPPPPPVGDPPGQASNPNPGNSSSGLGLDTTLSWSAGLLASSHDVYFGTDSTPDSGEFQSNQTGSSFDPGPLASDTTYYWRVDELNDDGTTQGITWSFATESGPEPAAMHVGDLDAGRTEQARKRWQAIVSLMVHDDSDQSLAGATINGVWSNGANGSSQCFTDGSGQCNVTKGNLKQGVSSVSFTVTSVTHTGDQLYVAGDNHDPDGDSDGVSITVPHQAGTGNTPPTVIIDSPADSTSYDSGALISFSGSADDNEDGDLSANLSWSSSIDGSIGFGGSFSTNSLSDGSHTITAAVTDGEGTSDTASIALTVGSTPAVEAQVGSLEDVSEAAARNRWNARVTVSVIDALGQAVPAAVVSGSWSNGTKGSGQCTTDSNGLCTITKSNLKSNVSSVIFSVNDISGPGVTYTGSTTSIELVKP